MSHHEYALLPALAEMFEDFLRKTIFPSFFLDRFGYTTIYPMFI
jgi:hypothetical protein